MRIPNFPPAVAVIGRSDQEIVGRLDTEGLKGIFSPDILVSMRETRNPDLLKKRLKIPHQMTQMSVISQTISKTQPTTKGGYVIHHERTKRDLESSHEAPEASKGEGSIPNPVILPESNLLTIAQLPF